MNSEKMSKILADLADGKITAAKAQELIESLPKTSEANTSGFTVAGVAAGSAEAAESSLSPRDYSNIESMISRQVKNVADTIQEQIFSRVKDMITEQVSKTVTVEASCPPNTDDFGRPLRDHDRFNAPEPLQWSQPPRVTNSYDAAAAQPSNPNGIERISLRIAGRKLNLIGDYSVAAAKTEGKCVIKQIDNKLEIIAEDNLGVKARVEGFGIHVNGRRYSAFEELTVRVNPNLLVDLDASASRINSKGVSRFEKVVVAASAMTAIQVAEIADARIEASSLNLTGEIKSGRNRIRCEAGVLKLRLGSESDVAVHTAKEISHIAWKGRRVHSNVNEVILGRGTAQLDIELAISTASITVD